MSSHLLTHSRMSTFRACPRKHELRYELGLQQVERSLALRVGTAFHAALEAFDNGQDIALNELLADPFDVALVQAMLSRYLDYWSKDEPLEVLATELPFRMPLRNPETGKPTPNWELAGVIDRLVLLPDGRVAMQEYKTTTRDTSPGSEYWIALRKDQQVSIYVTAARELGFPVETVLYDVTRRPQQKPLKATPVEKREYRKSDGKLYANQREFDETPDEFRERVSAVIAEDPSAWFQRIEIARLDQDLEDCAHELWQQQLAIRAMQKSGRWFKNPHACFEPFTCEFVAICEQRDLATNTPNGFVRTEDVHPELSRHATELGLSGSATAPALSGAQD